MKIYDITKKISAGLALWPGDQNYLRDESYYEYGGIQGHVSWIQISLHAGTHTDAPWHYNKTGDTLDQLSLEPFIGPCQVIHVMDSKNSLIDIEDIKVPVTEKRVLLRTYDQLDETVWMDDFKGIAPALVKHLHLLGVMLIGMDTPSVDLYDKNSMASHQALYDYKMCNIEGLNLNNIQEGIYDLSALPLFIDGADGSPVRAVLVEK